MFQTVIFDLDGTLLNTLRDLGDAANWVCLQNGWPTHTPDEYRYFVGNGIPKLVERFSPPEARTPARLAETRRSFGARYEAHKADFTAPYPGIPALLEHLRGAGVSFGVVTNKDDAVAGAVMAHYFGALVPLVQGRTDALPPKPDPATTLLLMKRLGADPATTLFVGDSDVDVFTARNAGLDCCGVLWGFRTADELTGAGAKYLAEDAVHLEQLILQNISPLAKSDTPAK